MRRRNIASFVHVFSGRSDAMARRMRGAETRVWRQTFDKPLRVWHPPTSLFNQSHPCGVQMAEPEWGQKRKCPSCDTRFYDLTNNPTTCPSCGESFALEALSERKSNTTSRSRVKAPVVAKVVAVVPDDDDDDVIDVAADDDDDDDDDDVVADVLLDDDGEDDDELDVIKPERTGGNDDS